MNTINKKQVAAQKHDPQRRHIPTAQNTKKNLKEDTVKTPQKPIRLVVAEDQKLIHTMLTSFLSSEANIEVVGHAYNGDEAIEVTRSVHPDIVLMDIRMPFTNGLEATRAIITEQVEALKVGRPYSGRSRYQHQAHTEGASASSVSSASCASPTELHHLRSKLDTKVIILTTYNNPRYRYLAHDFGASDFLLKDDDPKDVIHTIESVYTESPDAPHMFDNIGAPRSLVIPESLDIKRFRQIPELASITDRERDVILLIAEGYTNNEIAKTLHVSLETAKTHVHNILRKIHSERRAQIATFAHENALMYKYDSFAPSGIQHEHERL
ncbi:response regulator transcription factor [Alloscardovia macacae]|uniref:DNA-binding response regulator n=1 Tax=Alloscardovia macacae TaxID=1160091 RepID=A0A261F562_9BIFI|nr:response regulator transcription factor [Alloscardovia macacae]OZG54215.1 DNA-binding response regulator [Alloscardovia macacae]